MSAPSTPRFPSTPYRPKSNQGTPTTGSWRHPAMDTIVHRQKSQKGMADSQSSRLARNSAAMVATFVFTWILHTWFFTSNPAYGKQPQRHPAWNDIFRYGGYSLNLIRLVLLFNIFESAYRILRPEPDFSDIPLTPVQRKLLGLDPNVRTNAPADAIITPPRYRRSSPSPGSPTPRSSASPTSIISSPSSSAYLSSPYSTLHNPPVPRHSHTTATDGPMTPSPLRSTIRGGTMAQSLGFSVASGTTASPQSSIFNTPSPVNRTGQGLGLAYGTSVSGVPIANRWVYEKMNQRADGPRWTPGRNDVFSPLKGALN